MRWKRRSAGSSALALLKAPLIAANKRQTRPIADEDTSPKSLVTGSNIFDFQRMTSLCFSIPFIYVKASVSPKTAGDSLSKKDLWHEPTGISIIFLPINCAKSRRTERISACVPIVLGESDRILTQKLVSKRRTVLAGCGLFFNRFLTGILPKSVLPRQNSGLFQTSTEWQLWSERRGSG